MNLFKLLLLTLILVCLCACGGNSSGSGILIEGLLTQGEDSDHSRTLASVRHSAGDKIGEVAICALSECSITDDQGLYGFLAPKTFLGGEILFDFNGHGIETSKVVMIPEGASEVYIHFEHSNNQVIVHHMMIDGQAIDYAALLEHEHSQEHEHSDEHQHSEGESHE